MRSQSWASVAQSVEHLPGLTLWGSGTIDPRLEPCQIRGLEWLNCHVCHQEVSRCCTRGESEDSIACRQWSLQVWGIHPFFETQGRHHQKSKTGLLVASQKGLMSSKFFFKKRKFSRTLMSWPCAQWENNKQYCLIEHKCDSVHICLALMTLAHVDDFRWLILIFLCFTTENRSSKLSFSRTQCANDGNLTQCQFDNK